MDFFIEVFPSPLRRIVNLVTLGTLPFRFQDSPVNHHFIVNGTMTVRTCTQLRDVGRVYDSSEFNLGEHGTAVSAVGRKVGANVSALLAVLFLVAAVETFV